MGFFEDFRKDLDELKDYFEDFSRFLKIDIIERKMDDLLDESKFHSLRDYFESIELLQKYFPDVLGDKEFIVEKLKENKWIYLDFAFKEDRKDIVLSYLEDIKAEYNNAKRELIEPPNIYIENVPYFFPSESSDIFGHKEFENMLLEYSCIIPNLIKLASKELKNDKDFLIKLIQTNEDVFEFIKDDFKKDKEFCLKLIDSGYLGICKHIDLELFKDDDFAKSVITSFGRFESSYKYDLNFLLNFPFRGERIKEIFSQIDFQEERDMLKARMETYDINKNDSVDEIKDYNDISFDDYEI